MSEFSALGHIWPKRCSSWASESEYRRTLHTNWHTALRRCARPHIHPVVLRRARADWLLMQQGGLHCSRVASVAVRSSVQTATTCPSTSSSRPKHNTTQVTNNKWHNNTSGTAQVAIGQDNLAKKRSIGFFFWRASCSPFSLVARSQVKGAFRETGSDPKRAADWGGEGGEGGAAAAVQPRKKGQTDRTERVSYARISLNRTKFAGQNRGLCHGVVCGLFPPNFDS